MESEDVKNGSVNGAEAQEDDQASGGKKELTAAQKKREKQKMKKKQAQQHEKDDEDGEEVAAVSAGGGDAEEGEGEGDKGDDDKKKKKKKKAGAKEDPKAAKEPPRKGGPSKAQIAAIQEAIRKAKEEEERLYQEEDEKEQQRIEAIEAKKEKERLEKEKKERKKQKEKEKIARLKAEGKWLTPKEKLAKQRAQAMLEALKAQGVEVPEAGGEKKPRLGTRIRPKKQLQSQTSEEAVKEAIAAKRLSESENNGQSAAEAVEVVKEAWDQESEDEKPDEEESTEVEEKTPEPEDEKSSEEEDEDEETSDDDDDSQNDGEDTDDDGNVEPAAEGDKKKEKECAEIRIRKRKEENEKNRSLKNLRAPVVCVLGHVDTGKTKILDKLRRTHVQDNEAGGITQQIGATNVPINAIKEASKFVKGFCEKDVKVPGLLIIDTPGHESFSNLRSRGSSLCDIAILVVDIMHGLEPQTIESLNLLKDKKTPFVVALNKIDRLYDWQSNPKRDIRDVITSQPKNTLAEFEKRKKEVVVQFAEQGMNASLSFENPDPKSYISMVPTSAFTGEGMGNLMALIVELSQSMLSKRLMFSKELQATVLEVKAIPGLGTTVDVILINGSLRIGDTLTLAGTEGPITTQIRSLLTPDGMKELRVKNTYIEHKEISGAIGVKIAAKDLEKAIAGLNVAVAHMPDEIDICREQVAKELKSALNSIRLSDRGVYVQASTLGSLEALLVFLKDSKIPYSGIRIGPVVKKDVMKASIMLEHEKEYAAILAFDVKIERDAQEVADNLGVKIFQADIIYHLFDKFMAYQEELKAKKRDEFKHIAIFPCKMKILPQFIFNTRDPIVVGVIIEAGVVREGTPICVPDKEFLEIGRVTSIELNHKQMDKATKGQEVCIKIEPTGESPKMLGRHFEETDLLVSKITRESIDACKDYFRNDLAKSDWQLMVELKKLFKIM